MIVGILHPGEMGAGVGGALAAGGHEVVWASEGRSSETARRADAAGLVDAGSVGELARRCGVLLSICPPSAALDVARSVDGFRGLYVDANAVSPVTARAVGELVAGRGGAFVDGGIVGGPPPRPTRTRLYLSGERAGDVCSLFGGSAVDARVVSGRVGAASAVKAAYASWSKPTAALLLAIRALARAEGVEDTLLAEWSLSAPELVEESLAAARGAARKGWRWVGEMEEAAEAYAAAGLPTGFHGAAAEIFAAVPREGDAPAEGATLDRVLEVLRRG